MTVPSQKIFCIGLQRTGTTSLHAAFKLLGFNSVHGPFALYPNPSFEILDRYDVFSDNPVPLLYPILDEMCPDSKFILTTRDMDQWMSSVQWLFTTGRIEGNWQATPVIDMVHEKMYGTRDFDKALFEETWHRYHDGISDYFSDRPDDLLTIDIACEDKWGPICELVGKDVPDEDFPSSNRSSRVRTLMAPAKHLVKRLIGWKLTDHNTKG